MSERDWAERFSRDIDGLLYEAGKIEREPLTAEYRGTLDLARTMAVTDFSTDSQIRWSLRRQLLTQAEVGVPWRQRAHLALSTLLEPRRRVVAVVLVGLLLATLVWPGASTTVAQSIRASVQRLVLGRHTIVTQTASPGAPAAAPDSQRIAVTVQPVSATPRAPALPEVARTDLTGGHEANLCIIHTAIGRYGFSVSSDRDAVARRFATFEDAQKAAPFDLRRPRYLPAGYTLSDALIAPDGSTFLFYDSPHGNIILVQVLVDPESGQGSPGEGTAAVQVLTSGTIEPVTLNGQPAGWVEHHGLMWEADGVSYTVGGAGLSLDEAIRIAESLE